MTRATQGYMSYCAGGNLIPVNGLSDPSRETFDPADYVRLFGYDAREAREAASRDRDNAAKRYRAKGLTVATWKEGAAFIVAFKQ